MGTAPSTRAGGSIHVFILTTVVTDVLYEQLLIRTTV